MREEDAPRREALVCWTGYEGVQLLRMPPRLHVRKLPLGCPSPVRLCTASRTTPKAPARRLEGARGEGGQQARAGEKPAAPAGLIERLALSALAWAGREGSASRASRVAAPSRTHTLTQHIPQRIVLLDGAVAVRQHMSRVGGALPPPPPLPGLRQLLVPAAVHRRTQELSAGQLLVPCRG
jgi:hypothetical protein